MNLQKDILQQLVGKHYIENTKIDIIPAYENAITRLIVNNQIDSSFVNTVSQYPELFKFNNLLAIEKSHSDEWFEKIAESDETFAKSLLVLRERDKGGADASLWFLHFNPFVIYRCACECDNKYNIELEIVNIKNILTQLLSSAYVIPDFNPCIFMQNGSVMSEDLEMIHRYQLPVFVTALIIRDLFNAVEAGTNHIQVLQNLVSYLIPQIKFRQTIFQDIRGQSTSPVSVYEQELKDLGLDINPIERNHVSSETNYDEFANHLKSIYPELAGFVYTYLQNREGRPVRQEMEHPDFHRHLHDSIARAGTPFTFREALEAGNTLGINWGVINPVQLMAGMNVELEHGSMHPLTNVTNDRLIPTAKIALAHFNEDLDYYNKLKKYVETGSGSFAQRSYEETINILNNMVNTYYNEIVYPEILDEYKAFFNYFKSQIPNQLKDDEQALEDMISMLEIVQNMTLLYLSDAMNKLIKFYGYDEINIRIGADAEVDSIKGQYLANGGCSVQQIVRGWSG